MEACKAQQSATPIDTPLGVQYERVPATCIEVKNHVNSEQWLESDRKAQQVLILQGNRLMRIDEARERGYDVIGSVVQRKLKFADPEPGADPRAPRRLNKRDPRKSRICADEGQLAAQLKKKGRALPRAPKKAAPFDYTALKMMIAAAADRGRSISKLDVGTAYPKSERHTRSVAMRLPATVRQYDEDGVEYVMVLSTPCYGESSAGDEWDMHFEKTLRAHGWQTCEGVPAMMAADLEQRAVMIRLVDDLLCSQDPKDGKLVYTAADRTREGLVQEYGDVTGEHEPSTFAGLSIKYRRSIGAINISVTEKVMAAVRQWAPEILDGCPPSQGLKKGESLQTSLDSLRLAPAAERGPLSLEQKSCQRLLGELKWLELCDPGLVLPCQRASTVMCFPPPELLPALKLVLEQAYKRAHIGITYGGYPSPRAVAVALSSTLDGGAPPGLEAASDATFHHQTGGETANSADVASTLVTYEGGAVISATNKIKVRCAASHDTEMVALTRTGQRIATCRLYHLHISAEGVAPPTVVKTDSKTAAGVMSFQMHAGRSKATARRHFVLGQQFDDGEIRPQWVPDSESPADFLTKWLGKDKLKRSLEYATNSRVWHDKKKRTQ